MRVWRPSIRQTRSRMPGNGALAAKSAPDAIPLRQTPDTAHGPSQARAGAQARAGTPHALAPTRACARAHAHARSRSRRRARARARAGARSRPGARRRRRAQAQAGAGARVRPRGCAHAGASPSQTSRENACIFNFVNAVNPHDWDPRTMSLPGHDRRKRERCAVSAGKMQSAGGFIG
jgi:hypothetical protein